MVHCRTAQRSQRAKTQTPRHRMRNSSAQRYAARPLSRSPADRQAPTDETSCIAQQYPTVSLHACKGAPRCRNSAPLASIWPRCSGLQQTVSLCSVPPRECKARSSNRSMATSCLPSRLQAPAHLENRGELLCVHDQGDQPELALRHTSDPMFGSPSCLSHFCALEVHVPSSELYSPFNIWLQFWHTIAEESAAQNHVTYQAAIHSSTLHTEVYHNTISQLV